MKTDNIFLKHLGINGRMISASKSGYRQKHPNNIPVFNANIVAESDGKFEKIWYGDLDITIDEIALRMIALTIKKKIWILPEMAARFENENDPQIEQYVFMTDGKDYELGNDYYTKDSIERNEEGKLTLKQI